MPSIPPLSPIRLTPPNPIMPSPKGDPALQPSKQSLVAIPATTPSLEEAPLTEHKPKLKLSAIEAQSQGSASPLPVLRPQIILDLSPYKDFSAVWGFIESLKPGIFSYLKVPSSWTSLLNLHSLKQCEALGLNLFLDLSFSFADLERLPKIAYTQASLLSYNIQEASLPLLKELIQRHHNYLPLASMVFKTAQFRSLNSAITCIQEVLSLLGEVLEPISLHSSQALALPSPSLVCQAEELSSLRQALGPHFNLIVDADSGYAEEQLDLTKLPSLSLASCIILGSALAKAENPQLELEHMLRYLKAA